jgi:hypothetical protein
MVLDQDNKIEGVEHTTWVYLRHLGMHIGWARRRPYLDYYPQVQFPGPVPFAYQTIARRTWSHRKIALQPRRRSLHLGREKSGSRTCRS